jgi:hypothetical protein
MARPHCDTPLVFYDVGLLWGALKQCCEISTLLFLSNVLDVFQIVQYMVYFDDFIVDLNFIEFFWILEFSLKSPCLWASFHPVSPV